MDQDWGFTVIECYQLRCPVTPEQMNNPINLRDVSRKLASAFREKLT
jgi:hypothetical protein